MFWNARKKRNRLEFDACDPLHVIVPQWTEELQEADWLVHVLHLSEAQYRSNTNYRRDDDFIKAIKGKGAETGDDEGKLEEVARREGLTCGQNEEQIVLWEIYCRDPNDWNCVYVKTRSPLKYEEPARPDFKLPYTEGVFKEEGWFPFIKWRAEIKDKGHYSSRGLAEIQAPFETSLCKSWNYKHEWMDFFSRPMFEQTAQGMGNTSNFKSGPGAIIPEGLKPSTPPPIPASLDQDMMMTRQLAEYRVQAPDFGIMSETGGKRTATEISAISGQTGQGTDMRARIFRMDLGDTYKMAWALLLQFGSESLEYAVDKQAEMLHVEHLHDSYEVMPNGSADSWNKGAQMAKAEARFNRFNGNPYIKQGPLVKSVLSADEPGLVKTLYQEPQDMQMAEAEEQAMEIVLMLQGFPAAIDPTDDDKAHLTCLAQYVEQTFRNRETIEPRFARLALRHGSEHTNALIGKKDPAAKQLNQQLLPVIQALSQIAQMPDPREIAAQAAQNPQGVVVPMQPGNPALDPQDAQVKPSPGPAVSLPPQEAMR